jgi:hypothetical protein
MSVAALSKATSPDLFAIRHHMSGPAGSRPR